HNAIVRKVSPNNCSSGSLNDATMSATARPRLDTLERNDKSDPTSPQTNPLMPPLKIAIVGCGTAGMAAAVYLARAGHRVTLFERFATPQPVGAGLLLQPSGIAVLRELGLLEAALAGGAVVRGLEGVNHAGRKVLSLRYQDLGAEYFGIGIH